MDQPKVSVIIPVYNVCDYLGQCLNSVISQTLEEMEVICVNDGSTDNSLDILKEFAEKDSRITVITQENAGAGAARNNGMRHAHGKYLSFLDSDDFFENNMLEEAYTKAEQLDADFVIYKSDQYNSDHDKFVEVSWAVRESELPPYEPFHFRQLTMNIFKVFIGWAWDKLYKREFIEQYQLQFQEQRTTNDMLFVFSALVLAKRMALVPKILAHQRRDAKDSLSKTRENSWPCFYHALTALRERLVREGYYNELEKDFINYALHFSLWNYNTLAEPTKSKLKDKLVSEWFAELQIKGKSKDYFSASNEYRQYRKMMGIPIKH